MSGNQTCQANENEGAATWRPLLFIVLFADRHVAGRVNVAQIVLPALQLVLQDPVVPVPLEDVGGPGERKALKFLSIFINHPKLASKDEKILRRLPYRLV